MATKKPTPKRKNAKGEPQDYSRWRNNLRNQLDSLPDHKKLPPSKKGPK